MQLITVSTCSLHQFSLQVLLLSKWQTFANYQIRAWTENRDRIKKSIRIAKAQGSRLRCGPELEVTGYGCKCLCTTCDIR